MTARKKHLSKTIGGLVAVLLLVGGSYLLLLTATPTIAPLIPTKPIEVKTLPRPTVSDNRIIIPKIGINIAYGKGEAALDRGAEWRHPDRGNPKDGGNFIIAAHRLSIQPTPGQTLEKSPFYHIDKLTIGDQIIVDYSGKRYAYEISKKFTVKPTQVEIEAPSDTPKLTLYSCELGGSDAGRDVLTATPLGEIATDDVTS